MKDLPGQRMLFDRCEPAAEYAQPQPVAPAVIVVEPPIPPRDRAVAEHAERVRLSKQCERILARLQTGVATNDELAAISRKYTGRISDLRKAGCVIKCTPVDRKSGLSTYKLVKGI